MAVRPMVCKMAMTGLSKTRACLPGGAIRATERPMLSRIAALVGPRHAGLVLEFLRFGTVGAIGFAVETSVVYGTRAAIGLYWGGLVAYVVAASCNWLINRLWTFRGRGAGPVHRQWALFLAANAVGFAVNRGVYFGLITFSAVAFDYPVLAIIGGTVAGMFLNFHLSRTVVFK